jgi:hypothetical protein
MSSRIHKGSVYFAAERKQSGESVGKVTVMLRIRYLPRVSIRVDFNTNLRIGQYVPGEGGGAG